MYINVLINYSLNIVNMKFTLKTIRNSRLLII